MALYVGRDSFHAGRTGTDVGLALAGGAMLYVISDEMIPESHRADFAAEATAGLLVGFVLMMFLDTALG